MFSVPSLPWPSEGLIMMISRFLFVKENYAFPVFVYQHPCFSNLGSVVAFILSPSRMTDPVLQPTIQWLSLAVESASIGFFFFIYLSTDNLLSDHQDRFCKGRRAGDLLVLFTKPWSSSPTSFNETLTIVQNTEKAFHRVCYKSFICQTIILINYLHYEFYIWLVIYSCGRLLLFQTRQW